MPIPKGVLQRFQKFADGLTNTVLFAEAQANCDGLPRLATQASYYHNFGITQEGKPSDDPSYLPHDYTMFQVQPGHDETTRSSWLRQEVELRAVHEPAWWAALSRLAGVVWHDYERGLPRGHVQGLAHGVGVPGGAGTRREAHGIHAQA